MNMILQSKLVDEVHRRIGRNLLRYQEIEVSLKLILPYAHPDAGAQGQEALKRFREKHVTKKSLGSLIEKYRQSIRWSEEVVNDELDQLLNDRNSLVHYFYQLQKVDLLSPNGCEQACVYLDEQFNATEEWYRAIMAQSLFVLVALIDKNPELTEQYGLYRDRLIKRLESFEDVVVSVE
jgi:hypothetical protein